MVQSAFIRRPFFDPANGSKLALNGDVTPFQYDPISAIVATAVVATILLMAAMTREMVSWRAVMRRRAAERERSERMRAELPRAAGPEPIAGEFVVNARDARPRASTSS